MFNIFKKFSNSISSGADYHKVVKAIDAIYYRLERFDSYTENSTNKDKIKNELFYLGYIYVRGIEDKIINSMLALNDEIVSIEALGNKKMTIRQVIDDLTYEFINISDQHGLEKEMKSFLFKNNSFHEYEKGISSSFRNSFN